MMSFLFPKPKLPKPPEIDDEDIAEERRLQLARASGSKTILTGGAGVPGPPLGSASMLAGGGL